MGGPGLMATAYDGFKARERRKAKEKYRGRQKNRAGGATCGAKTRAGKSCQSPAGWGTNHYGVGACRFHGGLLPNHVKAAAKNEYRKLLGIPIEVSPEEALMNCIKIRSGEVKWLSDAMAKLPEKDWTEETFAGKQFHLFARERQAALRDVAKFSQMAISLNIDERRVRILETYGETIANLLRGILDELMPHMNDEGRKSAPLIVRRHLLAISGGVPVEEHRTDQETAKVARRS